MLTIEAVRARLPPVAGLQAVLVTSANAIAGLPRSYRHLALLAVGDATAETARAAGFDLVRSAEGNAADLAALCRACCDPGGGALLLAMGEGRGEALATELRVAGFAVERAAVYAARPADGWPDAARKEWVAGTLAAAMFFSAETARAFVRLIQAQGLDAGAAIPEALAIGPEAASVLEALPWRRLRVALTPTQDAMLALLT